MSIWQTVGAFLILVGLCGCWRLWAIFQRLARIHAIDREIQQVKTERFRR